jgi:mRNA interferase RelE/StbE
MQVVFKRTFLKDLERLPPDTRATVEQLVFDQLPAIDSIVKLHEIQNLRKLVGFKDHYRLRVGAYRIGFKREQGKVIVCRVLHRKDIYKYFP